MLGEDAGTINITSVLELETGTIDFNLREVRVGAGLCACPGPPRGVAPYRIFFLCIQSIDKRGDLRSNGVLGEDAGTIKFNRRARSADRHDQRNIDCAGVLSA